jgi:hypothetical protein
VHQFSWVRPVTAEKSLSVVSKIQALRNAIMAVNPSHEAQLPALLTQLQAQPCGSFRGVGINLVAIEISPNEFPFTPVLFRSRQSTNAKQEFTQHRGRHRKPITSLKVRPYTDAQRMTNSN